MFVWPLIAVAGILAAVWFFGVRRPGSIGGADAVRRVLREDHPEFVPAELVLDPSGTAALATDATGSTVILLFTMGNQVASRVLDAGVVRDVEASEDPEGCRRVVVRLHDLGCPRLALTLASADAPRWCARLERLTGRANDHAAGAPAARVSLPR